MPVVLLSRRPGRDRLPPATCVAVDSEQAGAVKVLTRMYQALIWEQGVEMRDWKQVRMATDMTNLALRARVELDLEKKYSPEQIAGRLDNTLAGLGRLAAS